MKTDPFDEPFAAALDLLKGERSCADLGGFERDVWSEIALRSESQKMSRIFFPQAMAACGVLAIGLGALVGISKAQAYDKEATLAVERRYVESIHPVMRSEDHSKHQH